MSDEGNSNIAKEADGSTSDSESSGKRTTLSKVLPSGRLTFPKQVEIIRAYGAAYDTEKAAVGIESIASLVQMAASTVSQSNAFLTEMGLVRKDGRRFIPAAEVMAMNRLFELSKEKAYAKLAPLFEKSWFGQLVIPKVRFRPPPEEDIVHELFEAATAERVHLPQIRMLIEYLVLVGLVEREGLLLRAKNGATSDAPVPAVEKTSDLNATPPPGHSATIPIVEEGHASYTLVLDSKTKRKVVIQAPHVITPKELDRIRAWLGVQLIVEEEANGT